VTVLGAGSWGTTLALILNENHHQVNCWSFDENDISQINQSKENKKFLPGIKLPDSIKFTANLNQSMASAEVVVVAIPSHAVRSVIKSLHLKNNPEMVWVNVAKGIENKTLMRVSEVISEAGSIPPENIAVLYGPTHAEEVSRKIPSAIVAASISKSTATLVQELFITEYFRVYANMDIIGVELGGSLKNIIAVAAGICDGAGLGDNTKAALITRGLVEINRMGVKLGAKPDTFAGLSGMGDLIVTCTSHHSRNRYVGEQIGKGRKLQDILNEMVMVAEGVKTTASVHELSQREKVEMPISEQVYLTLFENKPPLDAMRDLMTRDAKIEDWG
jgi:glycerol-3-phosphate dehydrogenase (NAD(P)+)